MTRNNVEPGHVSRLCTGLIQRPFVLAGALPVGVNHRRANHRGDSDSSRTTSCHRLHSRGFTLVELLVVVSIIALLISILLPSLKQAREQAKSIKCLAHSRGMGQSAMVFAGGHNGYFQVSANEGDGRIGYDPNDLSSGRYEFDSSRELLTWPAALARASGTTLEANWRWGVRADTFTDAMAKKELISDEYKMFVCPADRVQIATPFYPNGDSIKGIGDPADPLTPSGGTKYWGMLSYGINEDVVGVEALPGGGAVWKNGVPGEMGWEGAGTRLQGNLDKIYNPGTCLMIIDAGANSIQEAENGQFDNSLKTGYANLITSAKAFGPWLGQSTMRWVQRIPTKRHPRGVVNVTFADNHAASIKPTEFGTLDVNGVQIRFPTKFGKEVRVSPYKPWDDS